MGQIVSFIMTPLMAAEILVAEYIVAGSFKRKPYFRLRFLGSSTLCVFLTAWIEAMYFLITGSQFNYDVATDGGEIVFKIFYYLIIFGMTIFCVWSSYDQSFITVLVCCSIGYATQHLASGFLVLFSHFTRPLSSPYVYIANSIFWLISRLVLYTLLYILMKKYRFDEENYKDNNRDKVILVFVVIVVFICLSRLANDDPNRSELAMIAEPLYAMLCSVFIIVVELNMAHNDKISKELLDMKMLLSLEREQYLMTKENIEIINEKCHDLKHQIAYLRNDKSEKSIAEIEEAVMIYDSTVKTGSAVLDILLTEKKLQCESKNIKLTTVVNGRMLEFMDEMAIYSLFGNALSNAIESVSMIPDEDMRHIALKVKQIGNMCSIHVENPYVGELVFNDDLPETTKDKNWHGFGMKSMYRIVTSYGGVMTVTAEGGIFKLDILIPIV